MQFKNNEFFLESSFLIFLDQSRLMLFVLWEKIKLYNKGTEFLSVLDGILLLRLCSTLPAAANFNLLMASLDEEKYIF